ncbi:collagenase-like [Maniola hyperantus]|uniref:collagenase-like n=1 Tax=Aphantopus hyperantus TaxID=2795564 RepID=UPI0015695447|nr:collagenase-like [Maniola hyperantus]
MKLLAIIVGLALAVSGEESPVWQDYHEEFGIPEAARIKQAEQAVDFDGARIVGGATSTLGQHPHSAGLIGILPDGRQSLCGAAIVSNTRLLTTAHCWRHGRTVLDGFYVILGSLQLFSGGTRIFTSSVQVHADYNQSTLNNNLAIIETRWIPFDKNINSIKIASGADTFEGRWATASGFGSHGDISNLLPNPLRHVRMQVISNAACAAVYGSRLVVESVLCTATAGGQGICSGDSGGPLDVDTGAERLLIGLAAFHHARGCEAGFPNAFTRVTSFAHWIQERL